MKYSVFWFQSVENIPVKLIKFLQKGWTTLVAPNIPNIPNILMQNILSSKRLNHACRANAEYFWNRDTATRSSISYSFTSFTRKNFSKCFNLTDRDVRSIRKIEAGEEIVLNYRGLGTLTRQERWGVVLFGILLVLVLVYWYFLVLEVLYSGHFHEAREVGSLFHRD